jgi:hypothetical protein
MDMGVDKKSGLVRLRQGFGEQGGQLCGFIFFYKKVAPAGAIDQSLIRLEIPGCPRPHRYSLRYLYKKNKNTEGPVTDPQCS